MHTTLTPSCLHDVTFRSLKKPRSDPYNSGARPKVCLWRCSDHVLFVDGVAVEHLILRDQALRAFGEEYLVAELDRRLHLAALDEVGMGLEDRKDLLGIGHLLAVEHTAARLIDHTASQIAK